MSLWRMILTAINLVGVRFGGAAIGLLSQVLLARLLPQEGVGVVLMALSVAAIASLFMTLGYPALTLTMLPRYYALGRVNLQRAFYHAAWADTAAATVLLLALAFALWSWAPVEKGLATALFFGCLMAPASSLIRITSSIANSRRRFALSYVPDFLVRPGLMMLFLAGLWLVGARPAATTIVWAAIAIVTAVALLQAAILGRDALPELVLPRHSLARHLRPRAAAMVLIWGTVAAFADIVTLLGGLLLPAHDVAELGIAIRLAALAGFVTQATQNFVLPDLSAAITRNERRLAETLLLRINLVSMVAIAGCVVACILFGPLILAVFGDSYADAHWPLVLFMVSQLFRAAGGMNQHLLSIDGYQARSVSSCLFALMVLTAGAVYLTPEHGVLGMALAALLADAAWAAALGIQAQHYAGYRGDIFAVLRFHRQAAE